MPPRRSTRAHPAGGHAVIVQPRRSVTRFFIPLIDVLILLFAIFLLMPFVSGPYERGTAVRRKGPIREAASNRCEALQDMLARSRCAWNDWRRNGTRS